MRKLIIIGSILLSSLCLAKEVSITNENFRQYYVKYNGKLYEIEQKGYLYKIQSTSWEYLDRFVVILKEKNVTLVEKDSIKFKVEEE